MTLTPFVRGNPRNSWEIAAIFHLYHKKSQSRSEKSRDTWCTQTPDYHMCVSDTQHAPNCGYCFVSPSPPFLKGNLPLWGGKIAFSLVLQCLGVPKYPDAGKDSTKSVIVAPLFVCPKC